MKNYTVYFAIITASLIWGFATPIGKVALEEIPVSVVLFARFFVSFLIIGLILLFAKSKRQFIEFKDFKFIAKAGLWVTVINIGLFYFALANTSATDASIIYSLTPIVTIIIAAVIFKRKPSEFDLSGMIIAFAGAFLIISQPYFNSNSSSIESSMLGIGLMFLAVIAVSGYSFMAHNLPKQYNMLSINFIFFFIGTIGMLPFAGYEMVHSNFDITGISMEAFASLLFIIIFATVVAYIFWTWGLEKINPSEVNLFVFLQPSATILLAVPLLGEEITFITIAGVILTCVGIYIASSDNEAQRKLEKHFHSRGN
ncbi:MAG: DMT family transporter [Candidatus Pacearchaeota archaeon]